MNKILRIITWPCYQSGGFCPPWYTIAWRALWKVPFYIGLIIAWFSVLISFGPKKAGEWVSRVI